MTISNSQYTIGSSMPEDGFEPVKERIDKIETRDKCVICGKETPYTIETHIDFRLYYVEGCGQLCKECWEETDKNY